MLSPAGQGSSEPLTQDFSYEEKIAFERLKFNKGLNSQQAYEVIIAARGAAPPAAVTDTSALPAESPAYPRRTEASEAPAYPQRPQVTESPAFPQRTPIDPLAKAVYAPLPAAPEAPAIDPKAVYAPLPAAPGAEGLIGGISNDEKRIVLEALTRSKKDLPSETPGYWADKEGRRIGPDRHVRDSERVWVSTWDSVKPLSGYGEKADAIFEKYDIRTRGDLSGISGFEKSDYWRKYQADKAKSKKLAAGPAAVDEAPEVTDPSALLALMAQPPAGEGNYSLIDKATGTRNRPGHAPPLDDPLLEEPAEPAAKGVVSDPLGPAREGGQDLDSSTLLSLLEQARSALPGSQQVTTGDRLLQALQILGGIGGGIAADRATRRADKETARRQSVANLINTLRGRPTAKAAPATPKLGVGGRLLQGVGAIGKSGAALRDIERGGKQQAYENLTNLLGAGSSAHKAISDRGGEPLTGGHIMDSIAAHGASAYGDLALGYQPGVDIPVEDISEAREKLRREIEERYPGRPNMVATAVAEFDNQHRIRNKAILGLSKEDRFRRQFDDKTKQNIRNRFHSNVSAKVTEIENSIVRNLTLGGDSEYTSLSDSISDMVEKIARDFGEGAISTIGHADMNGAISLLTAAYDRGMTAANEKLGTRGPGERQKAFIAQKKGLMSKLSDYYRMVEKSELTGPWFGLLPAFKYISPRSHIADKWIEGFSIEIAKVLNDGRPTQIDAEAVQLMLPNRRDTPGKDGTAYLKFKALMDMTRASIAATEAEFGYSMSVFVDANGNFNAAKAKEALALWKENKTIHPDAIGGPFGLKNKANSNDEDEAARAKALLEGYSSSNQGGSGGSGENENNDSGNDEGKLNTNLKGLLPPREAG